MARTSSGLFRKIRQKLKYHLIMQAILDLIDKCGLKINPYYVIQEGLFGDAPPQFDLAPADYEIAFLEAEDMAQLDHIDGRESSTESLRKRLDVGVNCFALKYGGKVAAFTWCDFKRFSYYPQRSDLKANEAYLYDMHTLREFRGFNLAPYLRYRCYLALRDLGRDVLYSASEYFNTPAIRFKRKLHARFLRVNLCIGLFKKWQWNWTLKEMES